VPASRRTPAETRRHLVKKSARTTRRRVPPASAQVQCTPSVAAGHAPVAGTRKARPMTRKILVTSALPYANGAIHLGHLVEYIQTDIWTRFQKMRGHECWYVCADDTHGTPIMLRAEKEGITPEQLIARVHAEHSRDFAGFHVAFDNYHTTHSDETRHYSEDIYGKLKAAGLIEVRAIEQFYDPVKAMFLPDRFIKGECPKCGAKDQYGDACESCGAAYAPTELKNRIRPCPAPSRSFAPRTTTSSSSPTRAARSFCAAPRAPFARTSPRRSTSCRNGWANPARTSSPTGTSRAMRLTSASRSRVRRGNSFTSGSMRRSATWAPSRTCARKRASTSTPSGARARRPSSTTSSARTSSIFTPCSGRRNWNTPAIGYRPASSPTAS
jgi:hypothetical protein